MAAASWDGPSICVRPTSYFEIGQRLVELGADRAESCIAVKEDSLLELDPRHWRHPSGRSGREHLTDTDPIGGVDLNRVLPGFHSDFLRTREACISGDAGSVERFRGESKVLEG